MWVHFLHPTMSKQLFLGYPHAFLEEEYLANGFIVILRFARHFAVPCKARNAHIHVVEPHRVVVRTGACQDAVCQPVLLVHHMVDVSLNHESVCLFLLLVGFAELHTDECRTHGSSIVEGLRIYHEAHLRVEILVLFHAF